jgi:glyoxylase-like metal-dependent hydrolase (beta-lactamase superfamily II)
VGEGEDEEIFGLHVVATPGHTRGHIAVFDPDSAVLVAGDALTNTVDGHLGGSLPDVTEDKAAAAASVRRLAALRPRFILVGHGPPVERDAAAQLRRLANSLP